MNENPTRNPDKPRLIHVELKPISEKETLAVGPRGEKFRINAPIKELSQVLEACNGCRSTDEVLGITNRPEEYREVLETFIGADILRVTEPMLDEADWVRFDREGLVPERLVATEVLIYGDEMLVDSLKGMEVLAKFKQVTLVTKENLIESLQRKRDGLGLLLVAKLVFDSQELKLIDETCERCNLPWTQFHIEYGKAYIGPSIIPGRTANYHDLLMRRECAADYEDIISSELSSKSWHPYYPPLAEIRWMLSWWLIDVERWWSGAPTRLLSTEVELDPITCKFKWFTILPAPERKLSGDFVTTATKDPWILMNRRSGIILEYREIVHHPSVPESLCTIQTDVADMARHYTWANNTVCGGSAFSDFEGAKMAAIGEAVERYCGNCIDHTKLQLNSYLDFLQSGELALDPESLVLYSEKQYNAKGFPFSPFKKQDKVSWVKGFSLTCNSPIWIPASLIYVNWYSNEFAEKQPKNFLNYPGIAAGSNLEMALVSAIEEIIERDATMIWWTNRYPLPNVRLTPVLKQIWEGNPTELGQKAQLIHLDNEFNVPVMAGIVENTDEGFLNIGFAVRPDPEQAALKAWTEALTLQEGSRDLDDPDGLLRKMIEMEEFHCDLKPWRKDRLYLDDYRKDFHDVNDLMNQQQVFLDPRAIEHVRQWLDTPATRTMETLPRLRDRTLMTYQHAVENQGYEILYVDITTQDISVSGLKAVRVLIPGLVPNFPAAFPFLGKGRIQKVPVKLGWFDRPREEHELSLFPLPHA